MYQNHVIFPLEQKTGEHTAELTDPQWFVLFVRTNQEKMTAQRLAQYEIEHFLPCCRSLRHWKDRRVTLELPLFPGYVFVRLPFLQRARVLTLPNVISLVGNRNSPAVISEEEIAWIRKGAEHGGAAPHPYLCAGQRVIITSGILTGMEGVLVRRQNNARVVISFDSIERAFVVEVDANSVQPLSQPAHERKIV